jgi:hypothetical protein
MPHDAFMAELRERIGVHAAVKAAAKPKVQRRPKLATRAGSSA